LNAKSFFKIYLAPYISVALKKARNKYKIKALLENYPTP